MVRGFFYAKMPFGYIFGKKYTIFGYIFGVKSGYLRAIKNRRSTQHDEENIACLQSKQRGNYSNAGLRLCSGNGDPAYADRVERIECFLYKLKGGLPSKSYSALARYDYSRPLTRTETPLNIQCWRVSTTLFTLQHSYISFSALFYNYKYFRKKANI